jgi:hypothetical protein
MPCHEAGGTTGLRFWWSFYAAVRVQSRCKRSAPAVIASASEAIPSACWGTAGDCFGVPPRNDRSRDYTETEQLRATAHAGILAWTTKRYMHNPGHVPPVPEIPFTTTGKETIEMAAPNGPPPSFPGYTPRPQIRFEVIGEAWRMVQQQLGSWIVVMLVYLVVLGIFQGLLQVMAGAFQFQPRTGEIPNPSQMLGRMFVGPFALVYLLNLAVNILLTAGLYRLGTKQVRGEDITVGDIFSVTDVFGPLIIASIVTSIMLMVAACCCILPVFPVAALLMFTVPLIVDQRLDALAAVRASWAALKQDALMATLFFIVVSIVGSLGIIACCVGILVTFPIMIVSISILYRDFFLPASPPAPPVDFVPPPAV